MSRKEKIIIKCDNCEKELEKGEKYYYGHLVETFEGRDIGAELLGDGDFCEKCLKEKILKYLNKE